MGNSFSCEDKGRAAPENLNLNADENRLPLMIQSAAQDSQSEDEHSEIQEPPVAAPRVTNRQRCSVSAEAYGAYNARPTYTPVVSPKSPEEVAELEHLLGGVLFFKAVQGQNRKILLDALTLQTAAAGEKIITQGDQGDVLYILAKGEAKVLVRTGTSEAEVAQLGRGDVFGELALLYAAPRAATVVATSECKLWRLDRGTFNHIVVEGIIRQREAMEAQLNRVTLLSSMTASERSKLADGVTEMKFEPGEMIIKQGEPGDTFFMLVEGEATVTKDGVWARQMEKGDYFGELALLLNQPRAATVTAKTACRCLAVRRGAFTRLLGPVERILQRNRERYYQVLDDLKIPKSS